MRKKLVLMCLVLVFLIALTGCSGGGVTPSITEEAQVKNRISQFCTAISAKDFNLAKSYCQPGSSAYLMVQQVEAQFAPYLSDVFIWIIPKIYSINIVGNEATVLASFNEQICYQGHCEDVDTGLGEMILIKSSGQWYFYY